MVRKLKISLKDAFELIKGANKKARPNNAFVAQLKEYHQNLNKESTENKEEEEVKEEPSTQELSKEEEPVQVPETEQEEEKEEVKEPEIPYHYCCKICRRLLFTNKDIMKHEKGEGQESFSWHKRQNNADTDCTSLFIDETMAWMGDVSAGEGRLLCPKCSNRVGAWSWNGAQCSCGYVKD